MESLPDKVCEEICELRFSFLHFSLFFRNKTFIFLIISFFFLLYRVERSQNVLVTYSSNVWRRVQPSSQRVSWLICLYIFCLFNSFIKLLFINHTLTQKTTKGGFAVIRLLGNNAGQPSQSDLSQLQRSISSVNKTARIYTSLLTRNKFIHLCCLEFWRFRDDEFFEQCFRVSLVFKRSQLRKWSKYLKKWQSIDERFSVQCGGCCKVSQPSLSNFCSTGCA